MYKVSTPPAVEPVSLELMKAHARYEIADTSQDLVLPIKITAARRWIEKYCHIAMINQTITTKLSGWSNGVVLLECTPYASDLVVKYYDVEDTEQTLDPALRDINDYTAPPRVGIYDRPELSDTKAMPITITYVAGFGADADSVPAELREAILILATSSDVNRTIDTDSALGLVGHLIHPYKNEYAKI